MLFLTKDNDFAGDEQVPLIIYECSKIPVASHVAAVGFGWIIFCGI